MDIDAVAEAIQEVAALTITPRFGRLTSDQLTEKSPGEVVSEADLDCEAQLSERLRDIDDIPIVGEESASADPSLLRLVREAPAAWVVDPLDGTGNFARASVDHAVIVARVEKGRTVAGWAWMPAREELFVTELGSGAWWNGQRVEARPPQHESGLAGVVKTRFLPGDVAARIEANGDRFAEHLPGWNCTGVDYPKLVLGDVDFLFYWRTLPWDHAAAALFATEAGCGAVRPDGRPYHPGDESAGLLVAHDEGMARIRLRLLS